MNTPHQGTCLIHPTQTSRARPRARATAQVSSEIPRPAAFAAVLVVSLFSDTVISPFRLLQLRLQEARFGVVAEEGVERKSPVTGVAPVTGLPIPNICCSYEDIRTAPRHRLFAVRQHCAQQQLRWVRLIMRGIIPMDPEGVKSTRAVIGASTFHAGVALATSPEHHPADIYA